MEPDMSQPGYFTKYANFNLTRDDDGVLVVRLHTNGGPIIFTGQAHRDFPALLEEIALDFDNRAMVLTGTGDMFMNEIDGPSLGEMYRPGF
jgi:enoyl-CoA hydratase/carnithine racemase